MSKEVPILFSTPMVQAIISGNKTMTRRILKPQPEQKIMGGGAFKALKTLGISDNPLGWTWKGTRYMPWPKFLSDHCCPYGKVGDILWVRESWRLVGWNFEDGEMLIEYKDGEKEWCNFHDPNEVSMWVQDRVEHLEKIGCLKQDPEDEENLIGTGKPIPWKPSIHQPKEAARIWLKVKSVNVESLQDISDGNVASEGVIWNEPLEIGRDKKNCKSPAQRAFRLLWNKINGEGSWEKNPFVWVISFKVLSTTGKP